MISAKVYLRRWGGWWRLRFRSCFRSFQPEWCLAFKIFTEIENSPAPGQFHQKRKGISKFIRKEDLPAIRKQLKNHETMKILVDQGIDLATELSDLRLSKSNMILQRTCRSPVKDYSMY